MLTGDKKVEMIAEQLADISARYREFTNAFVREDREKLVVLFCKSQYHCLNLLSDICDDPKMKLMIIESELSCKAQLEEFEAVMSQVRDFNKPLYERS